MAPRKDGIRKPQRDWLAKAETPAVLCRATGNHAFKFAGATEVRHNGENWVMLEFDSCLTCDTTRTDWISPTGELFSRRYDYADGYRSKGLGRIYVHESRTELLRRVKVKKEK